jgi:hypothetical protein
MIQQEIMKNTFSDIMPESLIKAIEMSYQKSMKQSILTLNTIKEKRVALEKTNDLDGIYLLNFVQFTTISHMDFQVILKRYFHSDMAWEFNFNSRVFALTQY